MTRKEFQRQVISFLRKPEDYLDVQGNVLIAFDNTTIELKLKQEGNDLWCIEKDNRIMAENWILERLGKLEILANAILDAIPKDANYIAVPSQFESLVLEKPEEFQDTLESLISLINNDNTFVTNVYYVIAEACEGKTLLMNQLARKQAEDYLHRKTKWILLPIMLSGRPFLRLDEMIIGTLANFYRFNSYYIESCIELIKQGHIVLGLDGFEEMFVRGEEGEIVSSLGNLLHRLDSSGTLICSTRNAYYKYANIENQAKLFDSFDSCDVDFSALSLKKWGKKQFCQLMVSYCYQEDEAIKFYEELEQALTASHPLLTRAFFARKLIEEIVEQEGDLSGIICAFKNGDRSDVIEKFIDMIIIRETQRWISRDESGTVLLTKEQHDYLLASIAEEMWRSNVEHLNKDTLLALTELACSDLGLSPNAVSQCRERTLHHALLSPVDNNRYYSFCHEEFYTFFLGRVVSDCLINQDDSYQIRKLLDKKILPELSAEIACKSIVSSGVQSKVVLKLNELCEEAIKNSCLSQNVATILLRLLSKDGSHATINNVYCSSWAILNISLRNLTFDNCIIEKIVLNPKFLDNISFCNTDILEACIEQDDSNVKFRITFDQCSIPHALKIQTYANEIYYSYDPSEIKHIIDNFSCSSEPNQTDHIPNEDKKISLFYKMVQFFLQNTGINENLLMTKMGSNWSFFSSEVLNVMLSEKIVAETNYLGQNKQKRYKLNINLSLVAEARKNCHGNFDELLTILRRIKKTQAG